MANDNQMVKFESPRIVPWSNWNEWDLVKQNIWSSDRNCTVWALEMIAMWKLRGKIPVAIDSTASLMEVYINDNENITANKGCINRSVLEIQNNYALSIIRAVNSLVDPSQKEYAQSIYTIAIRIGLPGWLVELRHSSTHGNLPSLSVLRLGAKELLNWYKVNYWIAQQDYIKELSILCIPDDSSGHNRSRKSNSTTSITMINDIFVPLLIQGTIYNKPPDQFNLNDLNEADHKKYYSEYIFNWWIKFNEIIQVHQIYVFTLINRIVISGLDLLSDIVAIENLTDSDLDLSQLNWSIYMVYIWIDHLISKYKDIEISAIQRNISQAVLNRINTVIEQSSKYGFLDSVIAYIKNVNSKLLLFFKIDLIHDNKSDDEIEHSHKRLKVDNNNIYANNSNSSNDNNNSSENNNEVYVWKKCYNLPIWPLGLKPGKLTTDLYDIRQLN